MIKEQANTFSHTGKNDLDGIRKQHCKTDNFTTGKLLMEESICRQGYLGPTWMMDQEISGGNSISALKG